MDKIDSIRAHTRREDILNKALVFGSPVLKMNRTKKTQLINQTCQEW